MIERRTRDLSQSELMACQPLSPLHVVFGTKKWLERKAGVVETLEFRVDKAWLVPGCDRGSGCCPGGLLLRTPERQFVYVTGTVSSSPLYDFRWGSSYKKGRCDGDHVVVERWPWSKAIYSVRFSGAPVDHVYFSEWNPRRGRLRGPCEIVSLTRPNDLPQGDDQR